MTRSFLVPGLALKRASLAFLLRSSGPFSFRVRVVMQGCWLAGTQTESTVLANLSLSLFSFFRFASKHTPQALKLNSD